MRTINNINIEIKWEEISLEAMKAELTKRKQEGGPTDRLLSEIEYSQITIYNLRDELAELEGR